MAIKTTPSNILIFLTTISPLIITFFVILSSALNEDLKALFFLVPLIVMQGINIVMRRLAKPDYEYKGYKIKPEILPTHDICSIFELPFNAGKVNPNSPPISLHGQFWGYCLAYIGSSIISTNAQGGGTGFWFILLALTFGDLVFRYMTRCEGNTQSFKPIAVIIAGLTIGCFAGAIALEIWKGANVGGSNIYFTFEPPQSKCKVIQNKFKCTKTRKL
jgi:hypothetical protein